MLVAEFLEGLFGVIDKLIAFVFFAHRIRDGLYLLFPGHLPVFIAVRLDGGRRDFFQGSLRACIHRLVHRNDLGGVRRGDLLKGIRRKSGCGIINHLRLRLAQKFLCPGADARRVAIALSTPRGHRYGSDPQGKQRVGIT